MILIWIRLGSIGNLEQSRCQRLVVCGSESVWEQVLRRLRTTALPSSSIVSVVSRVCSGKGGFDSYVCVSYGSAALSQGLRNDILGGMAFEPNYEMLRRLQENYGGMSDRELFDLAARPDDLTEVAHEALRAEMTSRGIERALEEPTGGPPMSARELPKVDWGDRLPGGRVVLMTFRDAMDAGNASDWLDAAGIAADMEDVSDKTTGGGSFYGGPPVALQMIVKKTDLDRAMGVLREKMGLFPLQEVEEADPVVDDGTVTALGYFGKREDAEEVVKVLDEGRIWHRIVANAEGTVDEENAFCLEVREVDVILAGNLVEKAMGLS